MPESASDVTPALYFTSTLDKAMKPVVLGQCSKTRVERLGARRQIARAVKVRCSVETIRQRNPSAVISETSSFAPATVANFGPGFDWFGCAIQGAGDIVIAKPIDEPIVLIESIEGDEGKLPLDPTKNCVGIAAEETLRMIGAAHGVSLRLKKGLPLGSGMGSSAASAAASAHAVNTLFGNPLSKGDLVLAGLKAEAAVSGYHADNIAPAILGNFVMIKCDNPLELEVVVCQRELSLVLVTPRFNAPTKAMRAALPNSIGMKQLIHNSRMAGLLISGIYEGDPKKIGRALNSDSVVEPARSHLIPGFPAVKAAALRSGAYGCSISGAGPTSIAVVENEAIGEDVKESMSQAFLEFGTLEIQRAEVVQVDKTGARSID